MFAQLDSIKSNSQRKLLATSLALHALLFAWLLHTPTPPLLNATSVALGHEGKVLTRIYFPTEFSGPRHGSLSPSTARV